MNSLSTVLQVTSYLQIKYCTVNKLIEFTLKKRTKKGTQLWFYCENTVAHFRFYGFNLNLHLNTVILFTDIMLIYQPIEVLKLPL